VPELSHDAAEDGFHEIQLSGKQLVFLFIVTTSVVVGVFLFGVLVGRGARDPKVEEPTPVGATETPAPAPVAQAGPPAIEPPAPAADAPSDKVDYNAAPKGQTAAPEVRKPVEESKPVPPINEVAKEPPAKPLATSSAPTKSPAATPPAKPAPPAPTPAPASASVPSTARPGTWLVQVMATREQGIATALVKKLAAKGYPAFLVNPVPGAPQAFYKVQVGRYKDRSEAERVSVRIKKEEQFQSWILR
jgi:cell division septation protein DedD